MGDRCTFHFIDHTDGRGCIIPQEPTIRQSYGIRKMQALEYLTFYLIDTPHTHTYTFLMLSVYVQTCTCAILVIFDDQ